MHYFTLRFVVHQNMLHLLYPVSYLLSLTGLILWFYFRENRSASRRMSTLFMVGFLVYLVSLAFADASLSYKLLILFRDLVILGVVSQIFSYVRKSTIVVLVMAIIIYGLIQFAGLAMLYHTFPEVPKSVVELEDSFELLIETRDGKVPKAYESVIRRYDLTVEQAFEPADASLSRLDEFIAVGIPDKSEKKIRRIIRELRRLSGTRHVEYNEVIRLDLRDHTGESTTSPARYVNDPMAPQQWGWEAIQGDLVHKRLSSGQVRPQKQALIAIVDSGVEATHEDLSLQYLSFGPTHDTDPAGHGTHCAGIAAAVSNNGKGIASLLPGEEYVRVTGIKVMDARGMGHQRTIIRGIIQAADMGADVISLSLGSLSSDSRQKAYEEAIRYANAKGAIVIAAAGNSSLSARNYAPANAKGIIAVAALTPELKRATFSNSVHDLEFGLAAPGVRIMSTYTAGQYREMDGTSMAAPMVAGLVGLLRSFRPELTTTEVYQLLYDTGRELQDGASTGRMIQAADVLERVLD